MSNLKYVHMQQSGPIPGFVGWFSGGQTVTIDTDTMTVVSQEPMAQQAYDSTPLVEPPTQEQAKDATPVQEEGS